MQKLVFRNGAGNEIDLTAGNFGITNWAGLSNTSLNIQTQQVPFEDGGVFLDALMEQREIDVTVAIQDNNDLELRYQLKRELISALNPKLGEGVLIYTNDHLSKQIHAVPQIPLFENKNSNDKGTLKASVAFSCPSPYWEDVEETVIEMENGLLKELENNGDVPCNIKLKMYVQDEIAYPEIKNFTTNQHIKINNSVKNNVELNTEFGNKTINENVFNIYLNAQNMPTNNICFIKHLGLYVFHNHGMLIKTKDFKHINEIALNVNNLEIPFTIDFIYSEERQECLLLCKRTTSLIGRGLFIKKTTDFVTFEDVEMTQDMYESEHFRGGVYVSNENKYLIGLSSGVYVSNDLIDWAKVLNNDIYFFNTFQNKTFGVSGHTIYYSVNLSEWTVINTNIESLITSIYVDTTKVYILFQNRIILSSTDLNSWITESTNISTNNLAVYITKMNGNFYILYNWNYGITELYSGSNLRNMKKITLPDFMENDSNINNVMLLNNLGFVLFYPFYTTSDFVRYDRHETPKKIVVYQSKYKRYVGVTGGQNNNILFSYDLQNWQKYINESYVIPSLIYSEKYNCNLFLSVENSNEVKVYKNDGYDNVIQILNTTAGQNINVIKEYNDKVILLGDGVILYSENLNNWNTSNIDTESTIIDMCFDGEKYYALCSDGSIFESDDLTSFTLSTILENFGSVYKIHYSKINKKYFVGARLKIFVSMDLINWDIIDTLSDKNNFFYDSEILNDTVFANNHGGGLSGDFWNNYIIKYDDKNNLIVNFFTLLNESINNMLEVDDKFIVCTTIGVRIIETIKNNIINNLTTDSDMGFRLNIGVNEILLSSDIKSSKSVLTGKFTYRQKYIGV